MRALSWLLSAAGIALLLVIAQPLVVFHKHVDNMTISMEQRGSSIIVYLNYSIPVDITDYYFAVYNGSRLLNATSGEALHSGTSLSVEVPAAELGRDTSIVFRGKIAGLYGFTLRLHKGEGG